MATATQTSISVPPAPAQEVLAAADTFGIYAVAPGDFGNKIAQQVGITFPQLEAANPGVDFNNLQVGKLLRVPGSGGNHGVFNMNEPGTFGGGPLVTYSGPASNFPDSSTWQKFSLMWLSYSEIMLISDTPEQVAFIKSGINTVAAESGIDARVILSVIMQESRGNVHINVSQSHDGVINPGIMQSHQGVSFDENNQQSSILQMIRDGAEQTAQGPGIEHLLAQQGNIYSALRAYNSGSVDATNLSNGLKAQDSYVSDVANWLCGAPLP